MKKFALALLCIVSVAFFASCSKDNKVENPEPSIAVIAQDGYLADGDTINLDQVYKYGFNMASNTETNKELKSLIININGTEKSIDLSGTSCSYIDSVSFSFEENREVIDSAAFISATVMDVDGKYASAIITLKANIEFDAPLTVTDFTWNRHGGDDATGLAEYGLEWKSNLKDVFAQIKPMDGYTLYELNSEDWTNTQTINEKTLLLTNVATEGQSIPVFNKISAFTPASNLDYVLATINFTTYDAHILHITSSEVTSFKGTDVKIFGQAK